MPWSISIQRLLVPKGLHDGLLGRLLIRGIGALSLSLFSASGVMAEQPVFDTFSVLEPPMSGIAQEPYLAVSGESLLLSWMVPTASETLVQFARLDDIGWSEPVTVGRGKPPTLSFPKTFPEHKHRKFK